MAVDAPLIGRTLGGRYQITGHIGEGAMASVFRGTDSQSGGEVAIKVMHPHLAQDRTFTGRFKREAQAASMVKHPNSVAIYAIGEEQGVHFIVMELCHGRDLKETLKLERKLLDTRAARIVATIADALAAAHGLGVIHRDLKPENVMVEPDPATHMDVVKVLDFGIAKLVDAQPKNPRLSNPDSDPPPALTQFGVVVGTPAYMSPEQCRGKPLDGRSDLYTCGILLYQLVTGVLPFNSDSPFELAGKQAFEPPPPPSSHLPSLDKDLEEIILRLLAKTPDERYGGALELRDVLNAWSEKRAAPAPGAVPRGLSHTVPMSAVSANVKDYLRQNPPPQPRGGAPGPFAPVAPRSPIDTAVDAGPPQAMGGYPAAPLGAAPNATEIDPRFGEAALPPGAGFAPSGATFGQPTGPEAFGTTPGPNRSPPGQPSPNFQPASGRKAGWGILGFVCILLSLLAGVALGAGVFRFMGGPLPFLR